MWSMSRVITVQELAITLGIVETVKINAKNVKDMATWRDIAP